MEQAKEIVIVAESNFVIKEKGVWKDNPFQVSNNTVHACVLCHLTGLEERRR